MCTILIIARGGFIGELGGGAGDYSKVKTNNS